MLGTVLALTAATAAGGLFLGTIWRPWIGCAALALIVPLTGGLSRGSVIPVLRVSEALVLLVAAALAVQLLPRSSRLRFTGLDLVVVTFCLASTLIPASLVTLRVPDAELEDWRLVLSPLQFLLVYMVFSRSVLGERERRVVLNLIMLASLPIAAVAVAQYADLHSARAAINQLYPAPPLPSWDPVYRPTSLLGHYSALGAYGLLNFTIALALAALRHPGYPGWWLTVVMSANLASLLVAETYAPILALPVAGLAVVALLRRIPWRRLAFLPVAAVAGVAAFWPSVSGRLTEQELIGSAAGGLIPQTMQTRVDYWTGFFLPGWLRHGLWLGTGTILPPEVPRRLYSAVDNGYLAMGFRAGLLGLAIFLLLLITIAVVAYRSRASDDATWRAVGAVCFAAVASVVLLELTADYLSFTTVSQEFWMLVGLLAALGGAGQPVLAGSAIMLRRGRSLHRRVSELYASLLPDAAFLRSSAVVFAGFAMARLFGFLFSVAAARCLGRADYGRMAYVLALASVAGVLINSAPNGLSGFLVRAEGERSEQEARYTNWLAVIAGLLAISAAVTLPAAALLGLDARMLVGLAANLLGMAVLETYREVQRGLGGYALQAVHYGLANLLQLAAVVAAAWHGWQSPALFVIVYGLASPASLALVLAVRPLGLRVSRAALSPERLRDTFRFVRPLLLESAFYAVWFGGDLIMVERFLGPAEAGLYAAAKAMAAGLVLVPLVVQFVYLPRVARTKSAELADSLVRALALTAVMALPPAVALMALAPTLVGLLFGAGYGAAAAPLVVLACGMTAYSFRGALASLWVALGRPVVATVSCGAGVVALLIVGLSLIPVWGLMGAAAAFTAGAVVQVAVAGVVTVQGIAWAGHRYVAEAIESGSVRA